jgi:long-chain acyl-CoA synthetase
MIKPTRTFDFAYYQLEQNNKPDCLVTKYNGQWVKTSTKDYLDQAFAISKALLDMGIKKDDKIGIISTTNRTEWNIFDIAILQIGAQSVPLYPTITANDYEYILNHSECKLCIISDEDLYNKLKTVKDNIPTLQGIYSFNKVSGCKNWQELLEKGQSLSNDDAVEAAKLAVKPEDLATIIYTSGTTGTPKGVMLTHNNLVSNVLDSSPRIPFVENQTVALSFLPICHIFERIILYMYQYFSVAIYFAESIEKLTENINEVKPNVFSVVPRLLEKVYDKIYAKGADLTGIKKKLFFWAVELGLKFEPYGKNGWWYETQLKIARKLIFSKWQAALGGNIDIMVTGASALQPRLGRVFAAAGMPVMEGYGLTETSPVCTVNDQRNGGFRIGTVGRAIDNVELKIAEDGEILVKGPNVMQGYYKQPELTAEVIKDGYFHTGDIGEIDKDGFLKITDRKKEMFKTSGGKYIAPQLIEMRIKQSLFIENIMVVGDGEKMPGALIQPSFDYAMEWARRKNLTINTQSELVNNERFIKRIQKEIDEVNETLGNWEKIKRFELIDTLWSIDGGELTPTLKMKRKNIKEKYIHLYNKIYEKA